MSNIDNLLKELMDNMLSIVCILERLNGYEHELEDEKWRANIVFDKPVEELLSSDSNLLFEYIFKSESFANNLKDHDQKDELLNLCVRYLVARIKTKGLPPLTLSDLYTDQFIKKLLLLVNYYEGRTGKSEDYDISDERIDIKIEDWLIYKMPMIQAILHRVQNPFDVGAEELLRTYFATGDYVPCSPKVLKVFKKLPRVCVVKALDPNTELREQRYRAHDQFLDIGGTVSKSMRRQEFMTDIEMQTGPFVVVVDERYEEEVSFEESKVHVYYFDGIDEVVDHDDDSTYSTPTEFFGISSGRVFIKYMVWKICTGPASISEFSNEFSKVTGISSMGSFQHQVGSKSTLGKKYGIKLGKLKGQECEIKFNVPILFVKPASIPFSEE